MVVMGSLLCVAHNLSSALGSSVLEEVCSKEQVDYFKCVAANIRVMVSEVEAGRTLSNPKLLRDRLYEADNVVDKLLTGISDQQNQHMDEPWSCFWFTPNKRSQRLEQVTKKLKQVVDILSMGPKVTSSEKVFVYAPMCHPGDVVGRKEELNDLVELLLQPPVVDVHYSWLSIVGVGGIGKTTLAQLAYNHESVKPEFGFRKWVSVSKICKQKEVDVTSILAEILGTSDRCRERLQLQLQEKLAGKRFLLVLDDMWNEDCQFWEELSHCLPRGGQGSKVVVTTRFKQIARIVGSGRINSVYELEGLSPHDSWDLFQKIVFEGREVDSPYSIQLGEEIVSRCYNVPLLIQEVACENNTRWISHLSLEPAQVIRIPSIIQSLKRSYKVLDYPLKICFSYCALFPEDYVIDKRMLTALWMSQGYIQPFQRGDQSIEDVAEEFFSILLRWEFLEVFQRDEGGDVVSVKVPNLMHHVAQYVAEGDIECDYYDGRISEPCFHVSQTGITYFPSSSASTIRSYIQDGFVGLPVDTLIADYKLLRSLDLHCLEIKCLPDSIGTLLHLRYLNLSRNKFLEALPNSILRLSNLQSLDLRFCDMVKELPQGFNRLSNLRSLDTFGCDRLTHMPSGLGKLTSLRHLSQFVVAEGISSKKQLNAELRGLKRLVNLRGRICISIPTSYTHIKGIDWRGGCLEALEHLAEVWIRFMESHSVDNYDHRVVNYQHVVLEKLQPHRNITRLKLWGYQGVTILKWGVAEQKWADTLPGLVSIELRSCENLQQLPLLSKLPHLKSLKLYGLRNLECLENNTSPSTSHVEGSETLFFPSLEELIIADAPNLRGLWDGVTIPDNATFPTKLVSIELRSCDKLQHLPSVSKLDVLRSLKLYGLSNLEFLGKVTSSTVSSSFLPALEELDIVDAPKLIRLWTVDILNGDEHCAPVTSCFISLKSLMLANLPELDGFACLEENKYQALQFDQLQEVRVSHCPKLRSMADVPTLRSLKAINIHAELLEHLLCSQASTSSGSCKLQKVDIVSVKELRSLPIRLSNVESLTIRQCPDLCTLALESPSNIKRLTIQECCKLKCIIPVLNTLSSLEELEIDNCQELDWNMEEQDVSSSIKNFNSLTLTNISNCDSFMAGFSHLTTIEKLSLSWVYNLRALPDQIKLLTLLSHLTIRNCPYITALPDSLGTMSSLEHLEIENCPRLKVETDSRLRWRWPTLSVVPS